MKSHARIALFAFALLAAAVLPASSFASTATKHHLVMYKAEQQVTLSEGEYSQRTVSCQHGDIATDGMWRIDDVQYNAQLADPGDGPYDLHNGVTVSQSQSIDIDTYQFRFRNNSDEQAQAKIFVTCLGYDTAADTHQHHWSTVPRAHFYPGESAQDWAHHSVGEDWGCPSGSIFIAPSWKVDGNAESFASYPSDDLSDWTFGFYVNATSDILVGGRCLSVESSTYNGHDHTLFARLRKGPDEHFDKGNDVHEFQTHCGDEQKGLVGGYDLSLGFGQPGGWTWFHHHWFGYWLGMDPRPKTRAFKTLGGHYDQFFLVCFNDRTSRPSFS